MNGSISQVLLLISFVLFVLLAAMPTLPAFAQSDQGIQRLQHQFDSLRLSDSLRRFELQQQVDRLKSGSDDQMRAGLSKFLREERREDSIAASRRQLILQQMKATEGSPVVPFRDTLFFIYTRVGSFTSEHRATATAQRIYRLYEDYAFQPDSVKLSFGVSSTEIMYGEEVVMSVNELEALWHGVSTEKLAQQYRDVIANAIVEEQEQTSLPHIALRAVGLFLVIAGILLVVKLINRLFSRLRKRIIGGKEWLARGVRLGNYQFLDSGRLMQVVLFFVNALRLIIIVISVYIALPLMFLMFPWTEGIAETLMGWILTPLRLVAVGFMSHLPDLFTIIVIVLVTHYVLKFLKFITTEIESGALVIQDFYPDWARPTFNIVRFLVISFAFIIIFPYLPGSDSPVFQGVSVFLGLLLSLGSSSAISNGVAGLVITYMRPFKVGDRIKIGDISGDVVQKTLLVTRIRTVKNEEITVPNSSILSGHTINYTTTAAELGLILYTSVTIGYSVPWRQVHALLIAAARDTPSILNDEHHQPFVLQTALQDFYIEYQLNAYTRDSHRIAPIYSDLHQNIQDKFAEAGVEIMSPHYRSVRDGNDPALPGPS
jgi:small-conductance mechanosensitive channel